MNNCENDTGYGFMAYFQAFKFYLDGKISLGIQKVETWVSVHGILIFNGLTDNSTGFIGFAQNLGGILVSSMEAYSESTESN
jgi:hypothetical protein